jgi:hypothetical protein
VNPKSKLKPLAAFIARRKRRRSWVYICWLVIYIPVALIFDGDVLSRNVGLFGQSVLLIPVAGVIAQMIYPTWLGWFVIFVPTILYTGAGLYYLFQNTFVEKPPQWQDDREGFVIGAILMAVLVSICAGFIFARPKLRTGELDFLDLDKPQ